jgi:hypothetical protein
VRRTLPPSAEIEAQIDQLLAVGVGENPRQSLSELARLGARLIIQRAVEDEFDAWLGRARYERRPDYQRGLRNYGSGLRNGYRPRRVQTAEGELAVEIPQVRDLDPKAVLGEAQLVAAPDVATGIGFEAPLEGEDERVDSVRGAGRRRQAPPPAAKRLHDRFELISTVRS